MPFYGYRCAQRKPWSNVVKLPCGSCRTLGLPSFLLRAATCVDHESQNGPTGASLLVTKKIPFALGRRPDGALWSTDTERTGVLAATTGCRLTSE